MKEMTPDWRGIGAVNNAFHSVVHEPLQPWRRVVIVVVCTLHETQFHPRWNLQRGMLRIQRSVALAVSLGCQTVVQTSEWNPDSKFPFPKVAMQLNSRNLFQLTRRDVLQRRFLRATVQKRKRPCLQTLAPPTSPPWIDDVMAGNLSRSQSLPAFVYTFHSTCILLTALRRAVSSKSALQGRIPLPNCTAGVNESSGPESPASEYLHRNDPENRIMFLWQTVHLSEFTRNI